MRLSQLVSGFSITPPGADPEIAGLSEDSRRIERGMLFVAVPGTALDGHAYIGDAVARGAAAIVAERTGAIPAGVPAVRVPSSRDALALLASRYFSTTSSPLSLIGFTGTFGKTSTSDILRRLLDAAGQQTGVLGSLGARYKGFHDPGEGLTTPAPVELHRALRGLDGCRGNDGDPRGHEPCAPPRPGQRPALRWRAARRNHAGRAHRLPSLVRGLRRGQTAVSRRARPGGAPGLRCRQPCGPPPGH